MKSPAPVALLLGLVLLATPALAASASLHVLSATVKDEAIAGAELILQRNGQASVRAVTDAAGAGSFTGESLAALGKSGSTLILTKPGYSNLIVKCPCTGLTYAMSPVMMNLDGLRVVLSWGAGPADLDSHLVFADEHIFFNYREAGSVTLDVDQQFGFGPETLTIQHKQPGVRYLYAVHDYSDGGSTGSERLSNESNARVFVYVGASLLRTFVVPRGRAGNTWVVFAIGENGDFTDINSFADVPSRPEVGTVLTRMLKRGKLESAPNVNQSSLASAIERNREGEKAYHAKRLAEAVQLYLEAIDGNPDFGQAYSNLGLAYRKLGRDAEAIWANEKSITLAVTPGEANVRASSHYNIGRIREARKDWELALGEYEAALGELDLPDYRQSVRRMKLKLGRE